MKTLSISALVLLILALSNPVSVDASDAAGRSTAQRFYRTYLKPVRVYGFVHWETTGITDGIVVHRKKVPIQFRTDSDVLALRAFRALKWEVLAPNALGRSIFLIGQLYSERKFMPSCKGCATSEEYREFRLIDWYITTPFKVARWPENQLPLTVKISQRKELQRSDFDAFDGKDTIDVRRFQRKVRSKINRATTSDCGGPLDWVNSRR
jgi:hypothetical protein